MHPEITGLEPEPMLDLRHAARAGAALDPIHSHRRCHRTAIGHPCHRTAAHRQTRAIVYVQVANQDRPTFEGRTVTLGPRAGDDYLVLDGLKEGDRVVTHGNFKIDSELQIRGRPSMMSPPMETDGSPLHRRLSLPRHAEAGRAQGCASRIRSGIAALSRTILKLADRLAADDLEQAREAAQRWMNNCIRAIDTSGLLEADAAASLGTGRTRPD
jgi:hypothetical protein